MSKRNAISPHTQITPACFQDCPPPTQRLLFRIQYYADFKARFPLYRRKYYAGADFLLAHAFSASPGDPPLAAAPALP
jgi:hypothetical protein